MDTESGGTWVNQTVWQVSPTGINGITPGDIGQYLLSKHVPSPGMIVIVINSTPCGLRGAYRLQINDNALPLPWSRIPKTGRCRWWKFPNDWDSTSIFSKIMGYKLSDGSIDDFYLRCRMNLASDVVQNEAQQFMDLGLLAINTFN